LLPESLEYEGEFGAELILFLPFCRWLSSVGMLKSRRIVTYRGMGCFYSDLDHDELVERPSARRYVPPSRRPAWLPVRDEHSKEFRVPSHRHLYPDLRQRFGEFPFPEALCEPRLPLLLIHNKHNNEWDSGPCNHISLAALEVLFDVLKDRFTVVYLRHERRHDESFAMDHNTPLPFDDDALLARFPEVLCFHALQDEYRARFGGDMNTFKNCLLSRCRRFISSQGGGAHHIAMFSGSSMLVLHRRGQEAEFAYRSGYYRFMAPEAPALRVCGDEAELMQAAREWVVDEALGSACPA